MIKGCVTDKIYHGCAVKYTNSKRKLIDFENGRFWTEPKDLKMQTRSSQKNRRLLHLTFKTVKRLPE